MRGYIKLHHRYYMVLGCFASMAQRLVTKDVHNWWSMLEPVTTTVIGWDWSNIHEVCVDMGCQWIIYNWKTKLKIKEQQCTWTEGQKKGNIAGFINNTQPGSTLKQPNCIFESREGDHVFVYAIKSIAAGEELLIDYNLNHVDTNNVSMVVVKQFNHPFINYFNIYRNFFSI